MSDAAAPPALAVPALTVQGLEAWYGDSKALHGVTFSVRPGEIVALVGRNGAGKTTTLRSIMGLVRRRRGTIRYLGEDLSGRPPEAIARRGLAYCPEERGIFASLSVAENLRLPPVIGAGGLPEAEILALFPNLKARWASPGTKLSGGEQQMLAIGRILRTGARFFLLDEPTEGLAPVIVKQIAAAIRRLRAHGFTMILVEQNFRFAAGLADRLCVMERGRIVDSFARHEVEAGRHRIEAYLGV